MRSKSKVLASSRVDFHLSDNDDGHQDKLRKNYTLHDVRLGGTGWELDLTRPVRTRQCGQHQDPRRHEKNGHSENGDMTAMA